MIWPRRGVCSLRLWLDTASRFCDLPAPPGIPPGRGGSFMDGSEIRRPRLSLVLPAFDEEAGIRQAIAEADCALDGLCDDYEILVVDDGSRDATAEIVADESI